MINVCVLPIVPPRLRSATPSNVLVGFDPEVGSTLFNLSELQVGRGVTAEPQSNGTGNRQPVESEVSGCNRKQGTTGYLPPNTYRLGLLRWGGGEGEGGGGGGGESGVTQDFDLQSVHDGRVGS